MDMLLESSCLGIEVSKLKGAPTKILGRATLITSLFRAFGQLGCSAFKNGISTKNGDSPALPNLLLNAFNRLYKTGRCFVFLKPMAGLKKVKLIAESCVQDERRPLPLKCHRTSEFLDVGRTGRSVLD